MIVKLGLRIVLLFFVCQPTCFAEVEYYGALPAYCSTAFNRIKAAFKPLYVLSKLKRPLIGKIVSVQRVDFAIGVNGLHRVNEDNLKLLLLQGVVGTKGVVIDQSALHLVIHTAEGNDIHFDKNDPSIDPMVDVMDFYILVH